MKILIVNKFLYPKGGSETYVFKLGKFLESAGHQVRYFGMEHKDRCVGNNAEQYTDNMDFHTANTVSKIKYSLKTIYSIEARKKIKIVLENFKPDIVHLNNINFQLTPSIIYEIKAHGIPIVQTVHDVQIACPNHRMYNEQKEEICSECFDGKYINCIKNKCLQASLLKSSIAAFESYYYHKKDTYNLVDKYICPSQFMADVITKAGVKKNKVQVLHNFCDEQTNLLPKDKSKKYVLYFGRLSIEKGIKSLVEVCKRLKDIHFIFAGTGPLTDLCKGADNIELVGFKSGEELNTLIRNAMFSLNPSECNENCPMTILESMSLGTPVICSDLGGSPELIDDDITGKIFKAYDKDDLEEKIQYLYNNSKLLADMEQNCITASKEYTINKYCDTVLKIYRDLI